MPPTTYLCVHGQESTSHVWDRFAEHMKLSGSRVVMVDLTGHGSRADDSLDDLSFHTFVDDIARVVESNRLTRFTMIAHSMGGRIATVYAHLFPLHVEHLILMDVRLDSVPFREGSPATIERLVSTPNKFKSREELFTTFTALGYPARKLERWQAHGTIVHVPEDNSWKVHVQPILGYLLRKVVLASSLPAQAWPQLTCSITLCQAAHKSIMTSLSTMLQSNTHSTHILTPHSTHQDIIEKWIDQGMPGCVH